MLFEFWEFTHKTYTWRKARDEIYRTMHIDQGKCNYANCDIDVPLQPQLRCGACNGGKGAYYHLPCFFATHRWTFGS